MIQVAGERDACLLENTCILPLTNFSVCHVIMEMNMKMTTVMITMIKVHIVKKNLRNRCCYVTSINAMMTQHGGQTFRLMLRRFGGFSGFISAAVI